MRTKEKATEATAVTPRTLRNPVIQRLMAYVLLLSFAVMALLPCQAKAQPVENLAPVAFVAFIHPDKESSGFELLKKRFPLKEDASEEENEQEKRRKTKEKAITIAPIAVSLSLFRLFFRPSPIGSTSTIAFATCSTGNGRAPNGYMY